MYVEGSFSLFGNDAAMFSDMHKDVYGFRPRGEQIFTSIEEAQSAFDYLSKQFDIAMEDEEIASREGFNALLKDMQRMVSYGAKDPRHGLKWLLQGLDLRFNKDDILFLMYHYGISEYTKYEKQLIEKIGRI